MQKLKTEMGEKPTFFGNMPPWMKYTKEGHKNREKSTGTKGGRHCRQELRDGFNP